MTSFWSPHLQVRTWVQSPVCELGPQSSLGYSAVIHLSHSLPPSLLLLPPPPPFLPHILFLDEILGIVRVFGHERQDNSLLKSTCIWAVSRIVHLIKLNLPPPWELRVGFPGRSLKGRGLVVSFVLVSSPMLWQMPQPKQLRKRRDLFDLQFRVTVHTEQSQGRNLKQKTWRHTSSWLAQAHG